ncbi:MAG TPA: hypothetical protein EYM31_05695 [Acidobacteria bacterium]|nr:hypothetical protein [Acidobacteriota bacterium]
MAYRLAAASSRITAVAVDAMEFPDLARRYQVTGVPKTVVNDVIEIMGSKPEDEFIAEILRATE